MRPHLLDTSCFKGWPILSSADELEATLDSSDDLDAHTLLDSFYSIDQFPSTTKRFWEVIAADFA
jgi:hypothetical protein